MLITNYTLNTENNSRAIDIDITNIQFANDNIGSFEFWGSKEVDHQQDYVDSFKIVDIFINNQKLKSTLLKKLICNILYDDVNLYSEVALAAKEE